MALSFLLSCFLLWSVASTATAFNITKILDQHSDYATFNQLLSRTHVAGEVNKRKSVTVLAVQNGAVAGISSQPEDSLKTIMKLHVVLDFYNSAKIKNLKDGTKLTTLYQTTGSAEKDQGFLKVKRQNHDIMLGSAVSGAPMSAKINKVVTSVESDVSVVEISFPIVPQNGDGSTISKKSSSPSSSPSPSSDGSPSPSSGSSPSPSSGSSPSPSPSKSFKDDSSSDSPSPAPAPSHKHKRKHKHAPASAPSPSDEADDGGDDVADDEDADASDSSPSDEDDDYKAADEDDSSCSRNAVVSGVMLLASFIAAL